MINPFDYLWYKMYRFFSKIEKSAPWSSIKVMSILVAANLMSIIILMCGYLRSDYCGLIFIIDVIIVFPYFFQKKQCKVIARYRKESEKSRIIGNASVIIYIILTFGVLGLFAKCNGT